MIHYRTALAEDPSIPSALTNHIDQETAAAYAEGRISRRGVLVRVAFRKVNTPSVRSWFIEHAPWIMVWTVVRRSWSSLLGLAVVAVSAFVLAGGPPQYRAALPRVFPAWAQPIGQVWGAASAGGHEPEAAPIR